MEFAFVSGMAVGAAIVGAFALLAAVNEWWLRGTARPAGTAMTLGHDASSGEWVLASWPSGRQLHRSSSLDAVRMTADLVENEGV